MMGKLKIKLLREGARLPFKASAGAAACDLYALLEEPLTIESGDYAQVPTGIAIELPSSDLVALVFARSGLAVKHGITLVNSVGVVDSDYRGELKVGLLNNGREAYTINNGDRIAQLMITNCVFPEIEEVAELGETKRGEGGFGSTGER